VKHVKHPGASTSAKVRRVTAAATAAAAVCASVVALGDAGAATDHGTKFTVVKTAKFGEVLAEGDTVYTLKPNSTACAAKCRKYWPPVVLRKGQSHPVEGPGLAAARFGTRVVKGAGRQVTYEGKLLYWYYRDTVPGQVKGNVTDTWGKWSAVVLKAPSSGGSTSTSTTTSNAGTGGVSF
jgi:predicted lipoprotein with Yx(FWY)xxD motif